MVKPESSLSGAMDDEGLDFIVDGRNGKRPWNEYDYIEGGVANDRVIFSVKIFAFISYHKSVNRNVMYKGKVRSFSCLPIL